jgi:hypothetical protein
MKQSFYFKDLKVIKVAREQKETLAKIQFYDTKKWYEA